MKKSVILIVVTIFIVILIGGFFIYNKFIKEEVLNLNLDIDVYSDKTLFDYKENFDCELKNDEKINTENVGSVEVITHCKNSQNKRLKYVVNFNVVDLVPPKIFLKNSYTVTEGYEKKLTDVIISADNYDNFIKREIIGEYDFNTVGSYNLTYKATDNSGNATTQDFVLNVVKKSKNTATPNNSYIAFSDALKNFKTDNTSVGIDVSKWQGDIDFKKIRESGAEFVMIRIGYQDGFDGDYIMDPYFKQNMEKAKENNLKIGIYFYSYSNSIEESEKQAEWVINNLKNYEIDLPVVYDWEVWSSFNSINASLHKFNLMAETFLKKIEDAGYKSMLYSSKNYLENIWELQNYKTWLAHYTNKTNYNGNYYMWQMCSDGKIDGINGYVDIDILYK